MLITNIYRYLKRHLTVIATVAVILCLAGCDWLLNPDEIPPSVVIFYPTDGAYLTGPDTIKVEAVDNEAVESVAFLIDGVEIGRDSDYPYEQYWEVGWWADGEDHTILAKAYDEVDNVGLSNLVTVRISSYATLSGPVTETPAPDSIFAIASSITFEWHSVRYVVEYELEISATATFTDIAHTVIISDTTTTVTGLAEGSYYWRVRGLNDSGGGTDWSGVRRFYLATDPTDVLIFTEYEFNPVISTGDDYWNSRHNLGPSVIYDNGIYKMWFTGIGDGQYRVRYATSSDGIDWDTRSEPVLSPLSSNGFDEIHLRWPFVMQVGNEYRIYFSAQNSAGIWQIFLATSTDGLTWERYSSEPILGVGEYEEFDSGFTGGLYILYHDGTYYMWYTGGSGLVAEKQIGLAYSQDGFSWEKYSANPVMEPDPAAEHESYVIGKPWTFLLADGRFEMFYNGYNGQLYFINRAWSTDGINWTRDPFNPIIDPGGTGAWNAIGSSSPSFFRQDDIYHIWYSGDSGHGWSIGYGTARCAE